MGPALDEVEDGEPKPVLGRRLAGRHHAGLEYLHCHRTKLRPIDWGMQVAGADLSVPPNPNFYKS